MKSFLNSNIFAFIVCLLFAVLLSNFVADTNVLPTTERTFKNVTVQPQNIPDGLAISNELATVDIRVSGYSNTLSSISESEIKAYVDLSGTSAGTNSYKLHTVLPADVTLVWIKPANLNITLEDIETKTFPLTVRTQNAVAEGFGSITPNVSVNNIVITGPKSIIDTISTVSVSIDLAGLTEDSSLNVPVELEDINGNPISLSLLTLDHSEVSALISVSETLTSKSVSVRAAFSGELNEAYMTNGVEILPSTVKITGDYDLIKDTEYIDTVPIDISGFTEDSVVTVNLAVPEGITVIDANEVSVFVKIGPNYETFSYENVPVEIRNAPSDNSVYVALPTYINVVIGAYKEVVEQNGADHEISFKLYVDLEGKQPGDNTYPVMIELEEGYNLVSLSATEVSVVS